MQIRIFLPFKQEGPLYTLIITADNYHLMEWHLTLEDETRSDVEMGPARPIHPMRLNMFQGGMGHAGPVPPYIIPLSQPCGHPFWRQEAYSHVSCLCEFSRVVHFILTLKHFDLNIQHVGNDVVVGREKWLSLAQTSFCMEFSFICATKKKKKEKRNKKHFYMTVG